MSAARSSAPEPAPGTGTARPERRFCRFSADPAPSEGRWPLPPEGLCLSSFLLLSPRGRPDEVLVGRVDPDGPWAEIGALDPRRVRLNAEGWMLPSCHLQYFESPTEAADRIAREQLGLEGLELDPPQIFSETYTPRRHPDLGRHWDLEFVFRGILDRPAPRPPAWTELAFVAPSRTPRRAFTRSHDEVLEIAGFAPA